MKRSCISALSIVSHYNLRHMSARMGEIVGAINYHRTYILGEPEWVSEELRDLLSLKPSSEPEQVIDDAWGRYQDSMKYCLTV